MCPELRWGAWIDTQLQKVCSHPTYGLPQPLSPLGKVADMSSVVLSIVGFTSESGNIKTRLTFALAIVETLLPPSSKFPHIHRLSLPKPGTMPDSINFSHSSNSWHRHHSGENDAEGSSRRGRFNKKVHEVGHSAKDNFNSGGLLFSSLLDKSITLMVHIPVIRRGDEPHDADEYVLYLTIPL